MEHFVQVAMGEAQLAGILHEPDQPGGERGVLIVVGGPQYRVGSHRMFVLLARAVAAAGLPVLRFDFRGMGDSDGEFPGFDAVSADIRAACDALIQLTPGCRRLTLVGLCDGASAAAIYAGEDPRVDRIVMLNPWVHTEAGEARAFVWHYYPRRLLQADFWRGLVSGRIDAGRALRGLWAKLRLSRDAATAQADAPGDFIARMRRGLQAFKGQVNILLSDTDMTAAGFRELARSDGEWRQITERATVETVRDADHTFSTDAAFECFIARSVKAIGSAS